MCDLKLTSVILNTQETYMEPRLPFRNMLCCLYGICRATPTYRNGIGCSLWECMVSRSPSRSVLLLEMWVTKYWKFWIVIAACRLTWSHTYLIVRSYSLLADNPFYSVKNAGLTNEAWDLRMFNLAFEARLNFN